MRVKGTDMSLNHIDMVSPSLWGRIKGEKWILHQDGSELYVDGVADDPVLIPLESANTRVLPSTFGYKVSFENNGRYVLDGLDKGAAESIHRLIVDARQQAKRLQVVNAGDQLKAAWTTASQILPRTGYIQYQQFEKARSELESNASEVFTNILADTNASSPLLSNKGITQVRNILENGDTWLQQTNNKRLSQEYKRFSPLFERAGLHLTTEQAMAALAMEQGNILEAGAGSGKTVVIVARALYAVASGKFAPSEVMCVAFNKKATEEIRGRLVSAFAAAGVPGAEDVLVTTFHALGLKIANAFMPGEVSVLDVKSRELKDLFEQVVMEMRDVPKHQQALQGFVDDLYQQGLISSAHLSEIIDALMAAERSFVTSRWNFEGGMPVSDLHDPENPWQLSQERVQAIQGLPSMVGLVSQRFREQLRERGLLDFSGMTVEGVKALERVREQPQLRRKIHGVANRKCLLIDEFQDISFDRALLVKRLTELNDDAVVFGVGDDWQAINRFSGSDFSLFTKFESFFGVTDRRQLTATFRSCRGIAEAARTFVVRNSAQSDKPINRVANEAQDDTILFLPYRKADGVATVMEHQIQTWLHEFEGHPHIMVLDRNCLSKSRVLSQRVFQRLQERFANEATISFQTAHGSKGLEADYVIISGLVEGVFPSQRPPDYWVDMFLPREERVVPYADERRLFYVALTRAKYAVALLTPEKKTSRFVAELKGILNS